MNDFEVCLYEANRRAGCGFQRTSERLIKMTEEYMKGCMNVSGIGGRVVTKV